MSNPLKFDYKLLKREQLEQFKLQIEQEIAKANNFIKGLPTVEELKGKVDLYKEVSSKILETSQEKLVVYVDSLSVMYVERTFENKGINKQLIVLNTDLKEILDELAFKDRMPDRVVKISNKDGVSTNEETK